MKHPSKKYLAKTKEAKWQHSSFGFTLIELLLVMAIIGILAAAVIVVASGQRERARKSGVLQTIKGMQTNVAACFFDGNLDITAGRNTSWVRPGATTITGNGANCTIPAMPEFDCPSGNDPKMLVYSNSGVTSTYRDTGKTRNASFMFHCSGGPGPIAYCYYDGLENAKCELDD
jgi:prepilin-type N-terminal cleavage/methylation domain-containing protein